MCSLVHFFLKCPTSTKHLNYKSLAHKDRNVLGLYVTVIPFLILDIILIVTTDANLRCYAHQLKVFFQEYNFVIHKKRLETGKIFAINSDNISAKYFQYHEDSLHLKF